MDVRLDHYSDEELQNELDLRKKKGSIPPPPIIPEDVDVNPLRELVIGCVEEMAGDDYCDDNDNKHYIYEKAIETFYGKDIWNWINSRFK